MERLDIYDLKILPLSTFHIDYITRKIENAELILNVKNFEEEYEIKKKPYPIANKAQLHELRSYMETEKQGFISARITTMFELLRDFRTFTICQLEFRYSCVQKKKIHQKLKQLPLLLSRSALTKRLRNSGHIQFNRLENSDLFFSIYEMFQIGEKLELNNMKSQCRILRDKYARLFQNKNFDTWIIDSSNIIKLIIECPKFEQKMKEEMISKLLGACYNTDRYLRYKTNHPVNDMKLMGSYYTDSMYSYKIKRVHKSKMNGQLISSENQKYQKRAKVITQECRPAFSTEFSIEKMKNSNWLDHIIENQNSKINLNLPHYQIDTYLDSKVEKTDLMVEGFDFVKIDSTNTNEINDCISNSAFDSKLSTNFCLAPHIFEIPIDEIGAVSLMNMDNFSSASSSNEIFELRTQQWTKTGAIDQNFQITLKRMREIGWSVESLFAGDEVTVLKNCVHKMNILMRNPEQTLHIIQINDDSEETNQRENEADNQLIIEVQSMKISGVKLNNQILSSNYWEMIHDIYSWFMTEYDNKFIDEQTTKDLFLKTLIDDYDFNYSKVNEI